MRRRGIYCWRTSAPPKYKCPRKRAFLFVRPFQCPRTRAFPYAERSELPAQLTAGLEGIRVLANRRPAVCGRAPCASTKVAAPQAFLFVRPFQCPRMRAFPYAERSELPAQLTAGLEGIRVLANRRPAECGRAPRGRCQNTNARLRGHLYSNQFLQFSKSSGCSSHYQSAPAPDAVLRHSA